MDDELALGEPEIEPGGQARVRVLPVQVGGAIVYVEQIGAGASAEYDEGIYPVGPPSPKEAFEKANEALSECVRVVGETLEKIGDQVKPQEVSLEFSLSFQAEGTARIIPVLVTGKTAATTGLKVTATWHLGDRKEDT
jgi:Trypsin-co-occurring domain 1